MLPTNASRSLGVVLLSDINAGPPEAVVSITGHLNNVKTEILDLYVKDFLWVRIRIIFVIAIREQAFGVSLVLAQYLQAVGPTRNIDGRFRCLDGKNCVRHDRHCGCAG